MPATRRAGREWRDLQRVASGALQRADPTGLLELGAPASEYDAEAAAILPRLHEARTDLELATIIHEEFVRRFDPELAGGVERYRAAAEEIWNQWLLHQSRTLSGIDDAELIAPGDLHVSYLGELLVPRRVLRLGARYFIEISGEPGQWWMGERAGDSQIRVWGQYGSYDEAFAQH